MPAAENAEKRMSVRSPVHEDVYAAFRNGKYQVGLIKDISLGGLAFEYIEDEDLDTPAGLIDIFIPEKKFHIKNAPCRVIYKKPLPRDKATVQFSTYVLIRCGVQFQDLDETQASALKQLVEDRM